MNEPVAAPSRGARPRRTPATRTTPAPVEVGELDDHGAVRLAVALQHLGAPAAGEVAAAGCLDRRAGERDVVGGVAVGIGDVHVDDDVGLRHAPVQQAAGRYVRRMPRTDPDLVADELTMLSQFLEFHRATVLEKVSGLTHEELNRRPCRRRP